MSSTRQTYRLNIGCGNTPTEGWVNFDNSFSVKLAKHPIFTSVLKSLKLLNPAQIDYITFAKTHNIQYGDATKQLPLPSSSCLAIYSSHMITYLEQREADDFLKETFRLLQSNGVLRLTVSDLSEHVSQYLDTGDANTLVKYSNLAATRPRTLGERLRLFLFGPRHHLWMYDGKSLKSLLESHGFINVEIIDPTTTRIESPGKLNLGQRKEGSVCVEAQKP